MGLDTIEFVLWAEDEFGIDIPDRDVTDVATVGEFCEYVAARLALKDGIRALAYGRVFEKVASRLASEYRVPVKRITAQARFVKDLGLD